MVMVSHTKEKGERAAAEVRAKSGNPRVDVLSADFESLDSVRRLAEQYAKEHDSLNVLVNNAGLVRLRRTTTVDGFEATFQVNYLSPFLLTNLLLPLLKRGAPSRVVNVSSVAHYGGSLNFDDLQLEEGYGVMKAYSESKLALVLFTYELARRLEGSGVTVNCLHPGAVATGIWVRELGPARFLGKVTKLFMLSPEKGSRTQVYLASSPEVEGVTGKYFDNRHAKQSSVESYDQEVAGRLWDVSERMVGLDGRV